MNYCQNCQWFLELVQKTTVYTGGETLGSKKQQSVQTHLIGYFCRNHDWDTTSGKCQLNEDSLACPDYIERRKL